VQEIKITIKPDGSTETEVKGVKGQGCEALTREIEAALGRAKSKRRTPEFSQRAERQLGAGR
jgi:hypothetical protein